MNLLLEGFGRALVRQALPVMEERALALGVSSFLDLGPFPLPRRTLPVLTEQHTQLPPRDSLCAVTCFCLTLSSPEVCGERLRQASRRAAYTLLFDFKEPERNLEYPAALLAAPFRRAMEKNSQRQGGLEALLHDEGLRPLSRHTLLAGALCLMLLKNGAPS